MKSKLHEAWPVIIRSLRVGAPLSTAAAAGGVGKRTLFDWLRRGELDPGSEYGRFVQECKAALAGAEIDALKIIERAAKRNWCAAAWKLERRWPEKYGRRQGVLPSAESGDGSGILSAPEDTENAA